jgi:hypothetical protein
MIAGAFACPSVAYSATEDEQATVPPCACQCVCPENQDETTPPLDEPDVEPTVADDAEQPDDTDAAPSTDTPTTPSAEAAPMFSELLPDPIGKDTGSEFIELVNKSDVDSDLAGWSIRTSSGKIFVMASTTLPARGHLQFIYAESKLPLVNDGATLTLINAAGEIVDNISYPGPAKEGKSYARDASSIWQWTSRLTPGAENEFDPPEPPPFPVVTPEAAAETVPPAEPIDQDDALLEPNLAENQQEETVPAVCSADAVRISEFLPDPSGDDAAEWIELENAGEAEACLDGWSLDDVDGGSKPFMLTTSHQLPSHGFLVIHKTESRLALNNDGDSVRLLRPDGSIAESITYAEPPAGQSYSLKDSGWAWAEPSPGSSNITASTDEPVAAVVNDVDTETETPEEITPADANDVGAGTLVSLAGTVTLPPGRVGKTIFYIQDDGIAVKIRSYAKSPPMLAFGDEVRITGRIRIASEKAYISALSSNGIEKIGAGKLAAIDMDLSDLTYDDEGTYAKVTGTVVKKGLNWLKLGDGSDAGEIRVNLPEPLAVPANVGDSVTAAGAIRMKAGLPEIMVLEIGGISVRPTETVKTPAADTSIPDVAARNPYPNGTEREIPAWPFLVFGAAAVGAVAVWKRTRPLPLADLPELPGV